MVIRLPFFHFSEDIQLFACFPKSLIWGFHFCFLNFLAFHLQIYSKPRQLGNQGIGEETKPMKLQQQQSLKPHCKSLWTLKTTMEAFYIFRGQNLCLQTLIRCLIHRVQNIYFHEKIQFYSQKTECAENVIEINFQKVCNKILRNSSHYRIQVLG